ncbi:MAG: adenosylmethionine decarboxylase [Candidatus Aenigmarchaeota archaeon]|nr:adenosylmethionine decarboxylase [Candidatus Aenigmarchaeota archaeon]
MKGKRGYHICADLYGCSKKLLDDIRFVKTTVKEAVKASGLELIGIRLHKFNPHGITGYALLKTSHVALHTWPEFNYAAIDVFSCDGKKKAEKAMKFLLEKFKPKHVKKTSFERKYTLTG